MYAKFLKRFFDIFLSFLAIVILSPLLLIVALLVRIKLGGPVIFKQERVGKDAKIFKLYKFRSMLDPQTRDGKKLSDAERLECIKNGVDILTDEERLPKFGKVLRATSLDELPELWNILKGDMSFIGPRPLVKIYLPYYNEEEKHRHDVRPGLTGLAQVNGRNSASWEKRFKYDIEYVHNVSFVNDLKVFIKTIMVVFKREDIAQGNEKPEAFNVVRERELTHSNNNKEIVHNMSN